MAKAICFLYIRIFLKQYRGALLLPVRKSFQRRRLILRITLWSRMGKSVTFTAAMKPSDSNWASLPNALFILSSRLMWISVAVCAIPVIEK